MTNILFYFLSTQGKLLFSFQCVFSRYYNLILFWTWLMSNCKILIFWTWLMSDRKIPTHSCDLYLPHKLFVTWSFNYITKTAAILPILNSYILQQLQVEYRILIRSVSSSFQRSYSFSFLIYYPLYISTTSFFIPRIVFHWYTNKAPYVSLVL